MVKRPKVSIIIPIYNVEKYLSRCLESVIHQTLLDIEIIGVNDGTKDHSVDVIKKYMELDDRIQLIDKENGGVASARNAGIKAATGEMLLFLDSDDYLALDACERIYEERLNYGADIIVFGSKPFPSIPEPDEWVKWHLKSRNKFYKTFEPDALFKEQNGMPFTWNHAYSNDFLKKYQLLFPEDIPFGEDIVFLFKSVPQAGKILFIRDRLHYYQCFRQGSFMHQYNSEMEKKLGQHVENLGIITKYWHEKGWISRWGKDYFEWFIEFLMQDLISYQGDNKQQLAQDALKIVQQYGVVEWKKKVKFDCREKYRRLVRMAKVKA
ncbi:glycosyltransferase family 2 protein [Frisingicoccus sp.]|uniref:glycosyltransferase family 2 protein n=1 Tax=Frisingicoccus sp. TaxID=1918627 RepID=UPI003864839C